MGFLDKLFGGSKNIVSSSTPEYPSPRDVYLYILSQYEEQDSEFATFEYQADTKWVQVIPDEETIISFAFPFDADPNRMVVDKGIHFPIGYSLSDWERGSYVMFSGPKCSHSELAETIESLLTNLHGAPRDYTVTGWIE